MKILNPFASIYFPKLSPSFKTPNSHPRSIHSAESYLFNSISGTSVEKQFFLNYFHRKYHSTMQENSSRRSFIQQATTLAALSVLPSGKIFGMPSIISKLKGPDSLINGVQIGVITYSFREMPDQSAEATLQYILDCGISAVELMGTPVESFAGAPKNTGNFRAMFPLMQKRRQNKELTADEKKQLEDLDAQMNAYRAEMTKWRQSVSMDKFEQVAKMFKAAGVSVYAYKPDTFGMQNTDFEIEFGMKIAKILGANHVTLEHPSNDEHTLKLGKIAERMGVKVGYHGHEQQTHTFWDMALQQSPANALNLDFGHFVAAGNENPLDIIRKKADRIVSMHTKDRQSKANGGANLPWGTGNTPIVEALHLIRDEKLKFPATIELEYKIPEGSNSVKEVQKCLDYCRKVLS